MYYKLVLLFLGFCWWGNRETTATSIYPQGMFGDKFQGDIKLTERQQELLFGDNVSTRTGWTLESYRWPINADGFVIVPYRVNTSDGFLPHETEWMLSEFRIIESVTCIRFVERSTEDDFIEVINGDGCWSHLGKIGGRQELSISRRGCVSEGVLVHEAIHALGYDHMHNHIDRDNYVQVFWNNIQPEFRFAFNKKNPKWFDNFGTSYDLLSVMHYARRAFSNNGLDTIQPHDKAYLYLIGSVHMSQDDALRLNRMYKCRV